jgi:Lrp/AsnC family leucine-responsive transcriptional regulator
VELDALDRRILRVLQRDSLISNQPLADEVGLSPPACLKRVRRLRAVGAIERTVSLLSPDALGYSLLTVVRVKLDRPSEENMAAFEAHVMALPQVTQCMTVSGDIDYVLLVRSRDVSHYQDFARRGCSRPRLASGRTPARSCSPRTRARPKFPSTRHSGRPPGRFERVGMRSLRQTHSGAPIRPGRRAVPSAMDDDGAQASQT